MLTQTDYLLDGRVQITQNAAGYRAGVPPCLILDSARRHFFPDCFIAQGFYEGGVGGGFVVWY